MELLVGPERQWLARLGEIAAAAGARAWLVGGPVRDMLLGLPRPDTDLAIEGPVGEVAEAVACELGGRVRKTTQFMTTTVVTADGDEIDIAHTRVERYESPGALPTVAAAALPDDLARRDFTVNAMAFALHPDVFGELLDPYGGREDLSEGVLRVLHAASFEDDPTRMVRAARFMLRLDLRLEESTAELLARAVGEGRLASVSGARIRNELRRIFAVSPAGALTAIQNLGLIEAMGLPPADEPVMTRCGRIEQAAQSLGLAIDGPTALAACLGLYAQGVGVGPDDLAERLMLDGAEQDGMAQACALVHSPPDQLLGGGPDSELFFALESVRAAGALACWAASGDAERSRLEHYWRALRGTRAEITGADLIEAGHEPGPEFSAALRAAASAKIDHGADRDAQLRAALSTIGETEG